jgi:hypothetical protein
MEPQTDPELSGMAEVHSEEARVSPQLPLDSLKLTPFAVDRPPLSSSSRTSLQHLRPREEYRLPSIQTALEEHASLLP